jgi:hypothetical protein
VPAVARLMQADEDLVRQVIHRFNEMGLASLDPQWAGGRAPGRDRRSGRPTYRSQMGNRRDGVQCRGRFGPSPAGSVSVAAFQSCDD